MERNQYNPAEHSISDDALTTVTGGCDNAEPIPAFELGQYVYINKKYFGRVAERRYDETQATWIYLVETGFLTGSGFVCQGAPAEYPESELSGKSHWVK